MNHERWLEIRFHNLITTINNKTQNPFDTMNMLEGLCENSNLTLRSAANKLMDVRYGQPTKREVIHAALENKVSWKKIRYALCTNDAYINNVRKNPPKWAYSTRLTESERRVIETILNKIDMLKDTL